MSKGHLAEDITGQRFGKYVVLGKAPTQKRRAMWYCQCDCGSAVKIVRGQHLKSGRIISCGCVGREHSREAKITHGGCHERLYMVWQNMKNRCYRENIKSYKDYGARGIKVCDEWRSDYSAFKSWAENNGYDENAPYGKCTLDRIDVNGDYSPSNCRWVDAETQANNRRHNRKVIYCGEEYTLAELARHLGVKYGTVRDRVNKELTGENLSIQPWKK